jgi:N-acetyl-gamma-glutamylphosphate reductase
MATTNYVSGGMQRHGEQFHCATNQSGLLDMSSYFYRNQVGSSEGGAEGNSGSLHAERANVIRTFSAFGHRHTAE